MIDRAEETLSQLVLIRSTSEDPAGPMVDHVTSALKGMGLRPKLYGDKAHPAILAEHLSGGVLLSGHLDTVPHGTGWRREQGEVVSGVMYGRGTCDMKGGCTAMLLAAEQLVAS
ncbi:MAG: M20/M25/M40 family metallo-hydrolase, partial [Thermoplasmata archaeon]|nr:M20/M25/M40 family metallo-hydrolase [Thermoplasmata archaeon]